MGFNFGAFAGGAADGYRKQNEDLRKQSEEKRKQDEAERQDSERKQYEEIIKSTHGEFKEGLKTADGAAMPMRDAYGAEPAKSGMVMDGIIGNQVSGRQPAPASVNSVVAQGLGGSTADSQPSGKPLSVAAQGIMRPTAETEMLQQATAKEPTYREPDINDKFNYSDKLYGRLIEAGLFDKAKEVGQFRSGLLAEKLQGETKAREDAVRGGVAAIKSRNPKAILAALQSVSRFVPDGNDVTDVQMSGDGKYQITYGDNPPIAMNEGQLTSSILGAGKVETILDYDHRLQQTALQKAQEDRQAKHQDAVLKNQSAELDIRQSEHNEKRADTEKQKADAIEKVNAAVAIHKERNPNATPAQIEAVRRGVMEAIPKDAKNEYSSIVDQFGNTVTRTNKDTGAVDIIDVKKGAVKLSMPAPGARQPGGAPAQSVPPLEKREIGKAYQTPKGMMIWRGNGWSAN